MKYYVHGTYEADLPIRYKKMRIFVLMSWHGLLKPPTNIEWTVKSELGHIVSDMNTVVEVTSLKLVSLGQACGNESSLALASAWSIGTFTCTGSPPYSKHHFTF